MPMLSFGVEDSPVVDNSRITKLQCYNSEKMVSQYHTMDWFP